MATVMSDLQHAFQTNERYVGMRITAPDTSALMAVFKRAKPEEVKGRGLVYYWGAGTRGRGGYSYVAENGDLPAGGKSATAQFSVTAQLGVMTVEFNDHELRQFKGGTSMQNRESVAKTLAWETNLQRERILCDFASRDDSVKARCAAAMTSPAVVAYSSIPIRCNVGDRLYSYPNPGSGDARLLTGSAVTTESYVLNIETDVTAEAAAYTGGKITMSATAEWADESVLVVKGAALATSILGMESHFDTVNDASFKYDADDAATVDHGQESGAVPFYGGVNRASYSMLNVGTINASGNALSLNYLTRAAQKSIQQGGAKVENKLCAIMHPLQYDRFLVTQEGKVERAQKVLINGTDFMLPVITTGSAKRLSVITTTLVKDGIVIITPTNTLRKVYVPGSWDEGGLVRQNASSGQGHAAKWINYWSYWLNTACDMPFYTTLIYGLDTSNS